MADHFEAEQRFRQDTLDFMRQCLSPVPVEREEIEESGKLPIENETALEIQSSKAEDSQPSTPTSTEMGTSSDASTPLTEVSSADPSPRSSTTSPKSTPPFKRGHSRGSSLTKITTFFVQPVRRPTSSPSSPVAEPEEEVRVVHAAPSVKTLRTLRTSFREFASTIANYFRPRKDSAVDVDEPEATMATQEGDKVAILTPRSPLILSFKTIADGVCPHFSPHQHHRFLQECEKFVNATEREQALRVRGVLPELEEYVAMRIDTGAVGMCLALHEWVSSFPGFANRVADKFADMRSESNFPIQYAETQTWQRFGSRLTWSSGS